jgi:hypothetical protein
MDYDFNVLETRAAKLIEAERYQDAIKILSIYGRR